MGDYRIKGGYRLCGELAVGGAKNSALAVLAATVLCKGISIIHNCPRITDILVTLDILKAIGCGVTFENHTVTVDAANAFGTVVPNELSEKMRAAIYFMGSLMGRHGKVNICFPGGCELGERLINFHLKALETMGMTVHNNNGVLECEGRLVGKDIHFDYPSVGATVNTILAAVTAKGDTVIKTRRASRRLSIWSALSTPWAEGCMARDRRRSSSTASRSLAA
jgi:UDP-N-acetylglucosamine 1-carboxyvinyltransferase